MNSDPKRLNTPQCDNTIPDYQTNTLRFESIDFVSLGKSLRGGADLDTLLKYE